MRISANFDGGNIQVVNLDNKDDIQLAIRPDAGASFINGSIFDSKVRWVTITL
ncbi:hypothetical protein LFREDSHE_26580 [Shewanella baltica]